MSYSSKRSIDKSHSHNSDPIETKRRKKQEDKYSSEDLKGLAIGHKVSSFKEGQQVILTLRDKDVLEEDEDVLENVNLVDEEKSAKNIENKSKSKQPNYKPYDDEEFDELGLLKPTSLLSKYDEEIEGPKQNLFRIGEKVLPTSTSTQPQEGQLSLSLPELRVANEYYTAEEMVKFKKPKRKIKSLRNRNRKSKLEILPTEDLATTSHNDHGSRSKRHDQVKLEIKEEDQKSSKDKVKLNLSKLKDDLDDDDDDWHVGPDVDLTGVKIEEDEAEKELFSALSKTRKLKLKDKLTDLADPAASIAKIVQAVNNIKKDEDKEISQTDEENSTTIVLNTTAEFCRNLGELPARYDRHISLKTEEDELEDENEMMQLDDDDDYVHKEKKEVEVEDVEDEFEDEDDTKYRNNWNEVDIKMEEEEEEEDGIEPELDKPYGQVKNSSRFESKPILEEEPDVSIGVAGALKLAMNKGYLDKEAKKQAGTNRASSISAQAYTIEEKFYDDDRLGRRERYSGQLMEFREKDGYKPDFKLDYVDDKGRMMNQKEAFRYLSHKFHGKGPGMNKIDKRMKKMEQESKLRQMSSIDTPLNTLKLLQEKQKEVQAPYIVLSGQRATSSTLSITQISKKK